MFRRIIFATALAVGLNAASPLIEMAQACPMCKVANEQDAQLPRAYMYSILFMMGMMFSLGGGMAFGVFYLSRKERAAIESLEQFAGQASGTGPDGALPGALQPGTA